MRQWLKPLVALSLVLLAGVLLVFGPRYLPHAASTEAGSEAAETATRPVLVEVVRFEPQRTRIQAVGKSVARQSVTLYPAAAGEVTAVHFHAGQAVEAGDVLLELDRRDQVLALQLARVRLQDAERVMRRYRGIGESGAIAEATLDEARTALETARLEVQRAQVALDDRTMRAPFAGYVGITDVHPGDRISSDTPVTTLDDRSTLLVDFEVPEAFLGSIAVGDSVHLAPWSAGRSLAAGEVSYIGTRIDRLRRTFTVRATVQNGDDRLRPGMSFRVDLALEGRRYPKVPEVSVQWGERGAYVWALRGSQVSRVPVTIVQRDGGWILVDAALDEGAHVVTEGVQSMREGLTVRLPQAYADRINDADAAEDREA